MNLHGSGIELLKVGIPKMSADSGITKIADWRVKTLPGSGTLMLVTQITSMPTTCYTYLV